MMIKERSMKKLHNASLEKVIGGLGPEDIVPLDDPFSWMKKQDNNPIVDNNDPPPVNDCCSPGESPW